MELFSLKDHLKRNKEKEYQEAIINYYKSLIDFSIEAGILKGDFYVNDGLLNEELVITDDNIINISPKNYYKLGLKWFGYLDKTSKYDNKAIFNKYLNDVG